MRLLKLALVLGMGVLATSLHGQTLQQGAVIRVWPRGQDGAYQGVLRSLDQDTLVMTDQRGIDSLRLALSSLSRVDVSEGKMSRARVVLTYTVTGALCGSAIAFLATSGRRSADDTVGPGRLQSGLLLSVPLGALGGALGAAVGAHRPLHRWRRVLP